MYGIVNYGKNRYELQNESRRVAIVDDLETARLFATMPEIKEACRVVYDQLTAWAETERRLQREAIAAESETIHGNRAVNYETLAAILSIAIN